jgi:hypothetical protein
MRLPAGQQAAAEYRECARLACAVLPAVALGQVLLNVNSCSSGAKDLHIQHLP